MKKEKKKWNIIAIIISFIIIALIALVILIKIGVIKFNFNNKNNSNNNENNSGYVDANGNRIIYDDENYYNLGDKNLNYPMYESGEEIKFYKGTKFINSYKCTGKYCYVIPFRIEDKKGIIDDYVMIGICDSDTCNSISLYAGIWFDKYNSNTDQNEGSGKIILYNMAHDNVKRTYDKVKQSTSVYDGGELIAYLITYSDGGYQFVTVDDKINFKYDKDELVLSCYEGCFLDNTYFSYEDNIIVSKKNDKYGIKNLQTGEVLMDYKYDEIKLTKEGTYYNKDYFIGKLGEESNLYKVSDGTAVTKNGYEQIYFLDKDTLFVLKDKEFSFIDINENKVIDDTIRIDKLCKWMPKIPNGVNVSKWSLDSGKESEENVVYIRVSDTKQVNDYSYNLLTKKLVLLKSSESTSAMCS